MPDPGDYYEDGTLGPVRHEIDPVTGKRVVVWYSDAPSTGYVYGATPEQPDNVDSPVDE